MTKRGIENLIEENITVNVQTILTSKNIRNFEMLLNYLSYKNINKLFLSYLERSKNKKDYPSIQDIKYFKKQVVPKCNIIINKLKNRKDANFNLNVLNNLFDLDVSYKEISSGVYNNNSFKGCKNKETLIFLLGNGDILACNAVEYFHKPIVGNIINDNLSKILNESIWKESKEKNFKYCRWCPMAHHKYLKFK